MCSKTVWTVRKFSIFLPREIKFSCLTFIAIYLFRKFFSMSDSSYVWESFSQISERLVLPDYGNNIPMSQSVPRTIWTVRKFSIFLPQWIRFSCLYSFLTFIAIFLFKSIFPMPNSRYVWENFSQISG
jgi:hypothetical protein